MSSDRTVYICESGSVERITLQRDEEGLTLVLRVESRDKDRIHELRFLDVRDLRFLGDSTTLLGTVVLDGEDISSDGWDGVRLRVKDIENEFISFYCRTFERLP